PPRRRPNRQTHPTRTRRGIPNLDRFRTDRSPAGTEHRPKPVPHRQTPPQPTGHRRMTSKYEQLRAERWMPTRFGEGIEPDYAHKRHMDRLIAEAEYALSK